MLNPRFSLSGIITYFIAKKSVIFAIMNREQSYNLASMPIVIDRADLCKFNVWYESSGKSK
jgi:hypothetical protein